MTPGIRRLLTACSFALVASLPLAVVSARTQAPTWPSDLPVTRFAQEGDEVSLEFYLTMPEGQTLSMFSGTGLPPGLSASREVDGAGIARGVVRGTLTESTAGTLDGSAGVHSNVTLTATSSGSESSTYVFNWRVSRFRSGDVFAGVGGGKYRVFSEEGVFKYELTAETAADFVDHTGYDYGWGGGTTTGCGYNWVTQKLYFTAFDDDYDPAVYEFDPVPQGGTLVRTNRISTFRDSGLEKGGAATGRPIDAAPESVVFDGQGTIYVGHAGGYYSAARDTHPFGEMPADIDDRELASTDNFLSYYYIGADGNPLLDANGNRIKYAQGVSDTGVLEKWPGEPWRDSLGNPIQTLIRWGRDIQKFTPDGAGGWTRVRPDPASPVEGFDTHAGWQGSDWLDLSSDQRTIFYTSEWGVIYRYDVGPDPEGSRQLPHFSTLLPANPDNPTAIVLYALRLLPPGDGTGGLIVAEPTELLRLNGDGRVVMRYDAHETDGWFALNISPDGRSVWSASTSNGRIYRWDIASGRQHEFGGGIGLNGIPSGAAQDPQGRYTLDGLCVMGEYTAAQEICGDGIDNDGDGLIDENCEPIEICSSLSPGDDDGDGLVNANDPDCGAVNICATDGFTDPSVRGYCSRFNLEGDTVSLSPAPGPTPQSGDYETYTVTGLPPGISVGANGVLSGVPAYTINRNGDDPDTETFTVHYEVERRNSGGGLIAEYEISFPWTIKNVNRPPVAEDFTTTIRPGQTASFTLSHRAANVGTEPCAVDPDCEDTVSITGTTALSAGTLSSSGAVYTWTPPSNTFTGTATYQYTISDGHGGTDTGQVTIHVVNTPPVALADTATTRPGVPVNIPVLANDTDADAPPTPEAPDTLTIASHTQPSNGTAVVSGSEIVYTPNSTFVGVDTFTYTITDNWHAFSTATVTVTVHNQAPIAVDDFVSTIAGYPTASFNVLTMGTPDSDPDGDPISITAVTDPANGTLAPTGNSFVYTPNYGFSGIDTFTYTISDPYGLTDSAVVTITVRNLPPVAVNDSATTDGTRPVTIDVMQNDSDPDGHIISVTGATTPPNGTAVVNANGSITYTANEGFEGVDTFFYTITDGYGGQSTATVTITVGPPNRFDPCLCSSAKASPGEIWPPNHKETQVVTITDIADPDGGQLSIKILGIYQDEPTNYLGDGDTEIDGGGVGTSTAWVRAERTGNPNVPGNGRVYEIVFEATAPDGSTCQGSVFTGVPHDQGQGSVIIDDGIRYDSTVAGGPIVRTALKVEGGLTDADVITSGFELKYVAEARIGGTGSDGIANREMIIGPTVGSASSAGDFTWTSGQPVTFILSKEGYALSFRLLTSNQDQGIAYDVECDNGECDDIFIRAQAGGTGSITLSSLNLNGLGVADTLTIPVGGAARSVRLSGLALGDGFRLTGIARISWTTPPPAGDAVNFRVQVGSACPTNTGSGGGGGDTPPLARSDSYTTDEDTPLVVDALGGILLNDLTFAGPLSAELVSTTSDGTLELASDGSFVYTPNLNFNGQDTFRYRVSDGNLWSEPALVTITVLPVADPPIAVDDSATTNENTPVTIAVLANDSDPFDGPLSITGFTQPSNGSAAVSGTNFVYTPTFGFVGVDTFTYTITGTEGSATATVTVTVLNVNKPPVAVNDSYTTAEDTPLVIAAPGILGNDSDPDPGDTLSVVLVTGPSNGTLTQNANGSFTYTPALDYNGTDSYTYRARDAEGLISNIATVTITITPVNDPPVAVDDAYVVAENSVLTVTAPGVKANDSDVDTPFEDLTVSLVTGAQRGSLTLNPDGSFIYTPFPDVTGTDTFTYRLSDGTASDTAVVTIAITAVPKPPVAVDDASTTPMNTPVLIDVLANDTDPDTEILTIQSLTQPSNGAAIIVGSQIQYTPADGFIGQDVFTYTITDGQATSTATVTVTVTAVNDPPVAVDDAYTTPRNTVLNVQTPGILANDTDPDEDQLTARIISQPTSGSVVLQTHGAFAYTPANDFTGVATFTYVANDGTADSNVATVTITVTVPNDPPVAVDDSYSTDKNVPLTIEAPGILSNDSDPDDGDTLTATLISGTAASTGSVVLNPDGSFTFTPADDFTGTTTFRYRARDSQNAESNEAIVTIVVNDLPSGRVCYDGGAGQTHLRAEIAWTTLTNGDITARATVSRNYADNSYGVNKIGWGNKNRDFKAVYNSDFGQLAFYDAGGTKRIDFRIDYLTAMSGTPSGYGSLGVAGGDGGMVTGSVSNIVSMSTSMDLNMNAFGYVTTASNHPLKEYSPATNESYTPNATYPLWIWDMWYEATVKASTFGSAGFGTVTLRDLHASPSKEDVKTWRLINCQ